MAILIEGLSPEQILALPESDLDVLVLTSEPVAFRAGSAEVLGQFGVKDGRLIVELAHIDGGGEGVLPTLNSIAHRLANRRGLGEVEWIVHATSCARPNPKLLRVLERRGFEIRAVEGKGCCYHQVEQVPKERPSGDRPARRSAR